MKLLETQFLPEIAHYGHGAVPRLLIGTMSDVPNPQVSQAEAEAFAKKFNFVAYVPVSCKTNVEYIHQVMNQAGRFASMYDATHIESKKHGSTTCVLQ